MISGSRITYCKTHYPIQIVNDSIKEMKKQDIIEDWSRKRRSRWLSANDTSELFNVRLK